MKTQLSRTLLVAWLALAVLLILHAVLTAPGMLVSIQSEWQVQQAYPAVQGWLSPPAFGLVVFAVFMTIKAASLSAAALLAMRLPAHPPASRAAWLGAWLAAFTLLVLPGLMGTSGGAGAAMGGLLSFLDAVQGLSAMLALPGLILLFLLFPDGRFYPPRLRLPGLALLALLTALMLLAALQVEMEWGWGVLMLLALALLLTALGGQVLRYRRADGAARRVQLPMLLCLLFIPAWVLVSSFLGPLASLLAGQALLLSVPAALTWSVLGADLWGLRPAPTPRRLFLAAAVGLLLAVPLGLFALYSQVQQAEVASLHQIQAELATARPRPVIVDTDMAQDDILALMYLLNHPGADLLAITVTGTGEAHCKPGVRHALGLLEQAAAGPVPVTCGRETPLAGTQEFPADWRSRVDRLYGLALPPTGRQPAAVNAVDLILQTVEASPEKVTLIALGPLTNVAEALQADPGLAGRLEMVYIMGGAVDVGGNVGPSTPEIDNPYAEWNIFADPHAAQIVLDSGVPTTWVALDATQYAPASQAFYEKLRARQDTLGARFAYNLLYVNQEMVLSGGYQFWDVLTAAVAMDEGLARFETVTLSIVETPGPELGRTLRDPQGAAARLATWADGPGFENRFLLVLNRR